MCGSGVGSTKGGGGCPCVLREGGGGGPGAALTMGWSGSSTLHAGDSFMVASGEAGPQGPWVGWLVPRVGEAVTNWCRAH